ncbi:MAG: response regulator [Burkholderiales bacterium]
MSDGMRVFVVDEEQELRRALERLLRGEGYDVATFGSADAFLQAIDPATHGCCVLDVAMPELDGLALQERLGATGASLAIVFLTGHGDIPTSVQAMKAGAVDFLTKPVKRQDLVRAIEAGLATVRTRRAASEATAGLRARLARLTPREHEVMRHVIAGKLNKVIAADLGTTEHTVKVHRGRMMDKLEVGSVAELVRVTRALEIDPAA